MKKRIVWTLMLALLLTGCRGEMTEPVERETPTALEKASEIFPLELAQGGIIVERLWDHSGEYWENGEMEWVENVAAILVYNPGRRTIEFAAICLEQSEERLRFFLYDLPPGETCIVLEKEKKPRSGEKVTGGEILSIRWSVYDLAPEQVQWVGINECITVRNLTGREIGNLCIRYKRYCPENGCYFGGVSFSAYATDLEAGGERILTPHFYSAGRTRVVGITAERT